MKILLISFVLLAFSFPALCWPVEEDIFEFLSWPNTDAMSKTEGQQENINSQDEHEPPLPDDVAEKYRELIEGGGSSDAEIEQQVLKSGSTLGLQIYDNRWFSLSPKLAASNPCPSRCWDGCWTRCWGEVLQIYRMKGAGAVHSGDTVGIYYPREKNWFSMFQGRGHKSPCPGSPNINTGFNKEYLWFECWGEVFIVYAKGKSNGEQIKAGDRLAFLYPADNSHHVRFGTREVTLSKCMREKSNNNIMPSNKAFDECPQDSVWLAIR